MLHKVDPLLSAGPSGWLKYEYQLDVGKVRSDYVRSISIIRVEYANLSPPQKRPVRSSHIWHRVVLWCCGEQPRPERVAESRSFSSPLRCGGVPNWLGLLLQSATISVCFVARVRVGEASSNDRGVAGRKSTCSRENALRRLGTNLSLYCRAA